MNKKKIAVFSSGWTGELLYKYLTGLRETLADFSNDIYLFLCFPNVGLNKRDLAGELNIFNLPDMKDFDAALIFANGIDFPEVLENINQRCIEAGIPVIYTGKEDERFYFAGAENYSGTRGLAEHLVEKHGIKKAWFIAGSKENMDSNDRVFAVREVFDQNNVELKEEDICYSDWSPYNAFQFVTNRVMDNVPLPDVIICANDLLAMIICRELAKMGVNVPKDVMVTGFDNEVMAQAYDPAISSVDQRFDNIGRRAGQMLKDIFANKQVERAQKIESVFVPGESCGCCGGDVGAIRRQMGKERFVEKINGSSFSTKLTTMEKVILEGNNYDSLYEAFRRLDASSYQYEGKTYCMVLDPTTRKIIEDTELKLRTVGYPEEMSVIFSKEKGAIQDVLTIKSKDLFPFDKNSQENRFFILMPIHDNEYTEGYVVFGDNPAKIDDTTELKKYVERVNIILSRFLQKLQLDSLNRKLLQMTETDAMTHVKNRKAFDSKMKELQIKIDTGKLEDFALAVCDINNLKAINDSLGHEAGDEYIINSSKLICNTFKKSAVYRIGGDEFVILLEGEDFANRHRLVQSMSEAMKRNDDSKSLSPQNVSIAIGVAEYQKGQKTETATIFNMADSRMYENKIAMKESGI